MRPGPGVLIKRQILDPDFLIKDPGLVRIARIHTERHHFEILTAQRRLQPVQRRHLMTAGRAPGGPEIEQHHFTFEGIEAYLFALPVKERHGGQRLRLGETHEFRHFALRIGGERARGTVFPFRIAPKGAYRVYQPQSNQSGQNERPKRQSEFGPGHDVSS